MRRWLKTKRRQLGLPAEAKRGCTHKLSLFNIQTGAANNFKSSRQRGFAVTILYLKSIWAKTPQGRNSKKKLKYATGFYLGLNLSGCESVLRAASTG